MTLTEFGQGTVLCTKGEPLNRLILIVKGRVEMSAGAKAFPYEQGDLIGLHDLHTGTYSHTYTAVQDTSAIPYAYDGLGALEKLLHSNGEAALHAVHSLCRQMQALLRHRESLRQEAANTYEALKEIYPQYERLCAQFALTPKRISGLSGVMPFSGDDPVESWVRDYYMEMGRMDHGLRKEFFHNNPGICFGFLRNSANDMVKVSQSCLVYQEYIKEVSAFFFSDGGNDLYSLVTDLRVGCIHIAGANAAVGPLVARVANMLSDMTGIDLDLFAQRENAYYDALDAAQSEQGAGETAENPGPTAVKRNLSDSLNIILHYAGCDEELYNTFTQYVKDYTALGDRGDSGEEAHRLRKELTALFHEVYYLVFTKSLEDSWIPTTIKMFLHFGYVDAALAGHENADYLYAIADSLKGDASLGVYTLPEWLHAVYEGRKEPSRNENDLSYAEHLREKKVRGEIDAKAETQLLADRESKLRFEMENVFPIVNRLTFGRILMYCPLFSDQSIQGRLEKSLLTPALIREKIDEIRSVDFSAYYREVLYTNHKCDINNEYLHTEVLPDIVLMPNVGTRGILWQEIDGKNRGTPGRVFMPQFLETDLKATLIQLTGEFRWEICKRVQGIRWNDVTNPSLTSLFCDYMQFYKNNRELSEDIRKEIKSDFERARKNNRTMFTMYYAKWIVYEANGASQLNKPVLHIMSEYCPFSAAIREKLALYPRYVELFGRYGNNQRKKTQHLTKVLAQVQRISNQTPKELLDELEYWKK